MTTTRMTRRTIFLLGFLSGPGFAASSDLAMDSLLDMSLEQLAQVKVVTATLQEETLQAVPAAMSVYTRDEIRALGISRLDALMNFVPGFQSARTDDASFQQGYSSRGRALGSSGREVLVLIDGKRINSDFTGGAGFHDSGITLDNVERVEFIRGPGSSIYGSNAILGVVNVITTGSREVAGSVGSHEAGTASLQWQRGDQARNLAVYARHRQDAGERLEIYSSALGGPLDTRDPSREEEFYLRGHWDDFSVSARWAGHDGEDFYNAGYAGNSINRSEAESLYVNLGWKHLIAPRLQLEGTVFASDRQYDLHVMPVTSLPLQVHAALDEREQGTEWRLKYAYEQHHWLLGVEFRQPELYDRDTTRILDGEPVSRVMVVDDAERTIQGLYAQYQWHFSEAGQVIAGIRQDDYSDFGQHVSPRVGVNYQLTRRDTFKLLYAEAFRAPGRAERDAINGLVLQGNAELEPEVAQTTELVWLHAMDSGALTLSLFDARFRNAILEVPTLGAHRTWINGDASQTGAELELQQQLSSHWSLRMASMYLFNTPDDINSQATELLSGSLVYAQNRWTTSVRAYFHGPRQDAIDSDSVSATDEYLAIGGRTLVATHVNYQWDHATDLFGGLDNVFDKQYLSVAQRYLNIAGVPERGRTGYIGVRWRY